MATDCLQAQQGACQLETVTVTVVEINECAILNLCEGEQKGGLYYVATVSINERCALLADKVLRHCK